MKTLLQEHDIQLTEKHEGLIGVDEVGRGALAGPVFVVACYIKSGFFKVDSNIELTLNFRDSKRMSKNKRDVAFEIINELKNQGWVDYVIATSSVEVIESKNISGATRQAFTDALIRLTNNLENVTDYLILIDGNPLKDFLFPHESMVRGDDRSLVVSMASILAKVSRDRYMEELACNFPGYLWEQNKGYGTYLHRNAIKKIGASSQHRMLFLRKILKI